VPAAAVIPAPIAYIKVVAVKTLVVEILLVKMGHLFEHVPVVIGINPIHSAGQTVGSSELLL
jgi:hypothetical protein